MPAWYSSSDGQASKREIEHEGKKQGWDQLSTVSTSYTQASNQASNQTHNQTNNLAVSDAQHKQKDGAGLSQDARKAQGLELTPKEEQLLAGQVNMLCVCAQMMVIVCAWVQVLLTIFTVCVGTL